MQMTLKRQGIAAALLLASAAATAGEGDALMSFSTDGPDRYADGSPVMAGEVYALVWTRSGASFAGVNLDGSPVNPDDSAIVIAQPLAKVREVDGGLHGFCPPTLFQVDAAFAETHASGTYEVVLLDTRAPDASGGLRPSGRTDRVHGWGVVAAVEPRASTARQFLSFAASTPAAALAARTTTSSALPPGMVVPRPRITSVKVEGGQVKLTFTGSSPALLYNIAAGDTPAAEGDRHAAVGPVAGADDSAAERTLVVPVRAGQRFFKVVRNP